MRSGESPLRRLPFVLGVLIAALAGLYQLILASEPVNDQFMSLVWGREILFGRLPVRDFFEAGEPLMELISAIAGAAVGYRLLAEAIVVALAMGVGTWAVFWVTHQLTRSTIPATFAALLVAFSGARSYSYPKILLYAVAAALMLRYIQRQSWQRLTALALWTGAAFLWRHDHGAYLAFATTLAVLLAHGFTRIAAIRLVQAGALAFLVVTPYLAWVEFNRGIVPYVVDGRSVVAAELSDNGAFSFPSWPLRRFSDVVRIHPKSAYAPRIRIKWAPGSTVDEQHAVLARFNLVPDPGPTSHDAVRLLDTNPQSIRALLNDPIVEDTSGINRSTSTLPPASWTAVNRMRFRYPWLRVNVLSAFETPERAGQSAAWLFIALGIVAVAWSARPRKDSDPVGLERRKTVAGIAAFSLVSIPGLLRQPLSVYAPDVVVLPAILAGWAAWEVWRFKSTHVPTLSLASRTGVVLFCSLLMFSVSGVGQLHRRVDWLAGSWKSLAGVKSTWRGAWRRLVVSPPIAYWHGKNTPTTIALARYVQSCTAPDAPLMVVSFSPDLQFYANRRLASRHLLLGPGRWTSDGDQEMSLVKLRKDPPPVVIAQEPFYSTRFSAAYPALAQYLRSEYVTAGTLPDDNGHIYLVLTRADLTPSGIYQQADWPCFAPDAALASR